MNYKKFQKHLLKWYGNSARKLPWRETKDPYKIWVSEIMLQQTQVDTVIDYYKRWIKTFPTVEQLAGAPESTALKHWAGLGYYRRARMLHAGAKRVTEAYQGKVPSEVPELLKIPGIGRYTAGAISSIAFEKRAPIVDGNVMRILTRLLAIKDDIGASATQKKLWQIAEDILPDKNIGDFNQAMMELGATVCFPTSPKCGICPVSAECAALAMNKQTDFPVRKERTKLESIRNYALVLRQKGKVLIQKQANHERWGGLWMFPFWEKKKDMQTLTGNETTKKFMSIQHGYTKYKITLDVYENEIKEQVSVKENETKWVTPKQLNKYALPAPHKRIMKELQKQYG